MYINVLSAYFYVCIYISLQTLYFVKLSLFLLINIPTRPLRLQKRLSPGQHRTILPPQPLRLQLLQPILNLIRLPASNPEDLARKRQLGARMRGCRSAVGRRAEDDCARDVGRLVGGEVLLVPALLDAADHARLGHPRADGVDADVLFQCRHAQAAQDAQYAVLAGCVGDEAAALFESGDAADEDQIAPGALLRTLVLAQVVHANTRREQRALEIDVYLSRGRLDGDVCLGQKRILVDSDSGISDDDVDAAEFFLRGFEQPQLVRIQGRVAVDIADPVPAEL